MKTEAVADLKIEREAIAAQFPALAHFETKHFLFSTDVPRGKMQPYVDKLDAMYAWMCKLYGLDPESQVFHGKALIVVFSKRTDFCRFERVMMRNDGSGFQGCATSSAMAGFW